MRTPQNAAVRRILSWGLLAMLGARGNAAFGEGSRSLYPSGIAGSRANLDLQPGTKYLSRVMRRGFLYVYATQNEYIVLGSRNRSNGGDISVYNPQGFGTPGDETIPGAANFTCSGGSVAPGPHYSGGTLGTITSRAQELAGPNSADNSVLVTNGFQPCAYRVPSSGVYGVLFAVATAGGVGPTGSIATPNIGSDGVSAWDVTVRANATSTSDLNGRLFTYAFVGFTGANSRPVYSSHYYVTGDGYRYKEDLSGPMNLGLDPNGYAVFANSLGFLDNLQPLYKDIRGAQAMVTSAPPGVTSQIAQYPLFFSDVSAAAPHAAQVNTVLTTLGIPLSPPSPTVANVSFSGHVGGSTTTTGAGGAFTFTTTNTITFQIVISRNGVDFSPGTVTNGIVTGIAGTGTHTVSWDGKDQAGANFPSSATPYSFRVFGRAGEVHFPIVDAENNPGAGPIITRLNGTGAPSTTVFFDDRGYRTSGGTVVGVVAGTLCDATPPTPPSPPFNLDGVDSSSSAGGGYRDWVAGGNSNTDCAATAGWGDAKGLNLWTYYSAPFQSNTLNIDPIVIDVATSVTAPSSAITGSVVQGAFGFTNNGNATATGVTYGLTLTAGLGSVTFGNLPSGTTASYNSATGVVTFGGTPLPTSLTSGQSIGGMTFSYTAPASGPVVATTTINTTLTDNYPANNTATASTGIGSVDVLTSVSVPASAATGSTVSGTFSFANFGTDAASGVTYAATIGTAGNRPASVTFTTLPSGVTAVYDNANGQVTFTGLPTSLASGQTFGFAFSYTAPSPGTVPVNTSITTTSPDANAANNAASGTTTITAPDLTLVKSDGGATFTVGVNGAYTLTVNNIGSSGTTGDVTVTDTLPAGLSFVSGTGTSFTCSAALQVVTCTRLAATPIAVGGSVGITLVVSVGPAAAPSVSNTASVSTPGEVVTGNNSGSDTTPVTPIADVTTTVTVPASVAAGSTVNGTATFSNNGPSTAAGATYSLTLSPGLGSVSFPTLPSGVTASYANATGIVTLTGMPASLTSGQTLGFGFSYTAPGSGPVVVQTTIGTSTSQGVNAAPDSASGSTDIFPRADLQISKTDGSATYTPGGSLTYTIVVSNSGPSPVTGATVADTFPSGLSMGAWSCGGTGGGSCPPSGGGTISALVDLPVGASVTFTVPGTVSGSMTGYLVNTATVTAPAGITDPNLANNSARDTDHSSAAGQNCAAGWTRISYDWNGKTFSDGVPFAVGGVNVTASKSGGFSGGTPTVDGAITGGTGGNTLHLEHTGASGASPAVLTFSFSVPVNDLKFTLLDVDACSNASPPECPTAGSRWRDGVTLSPAGGLVLVPATPTNSVSGAVVTGDQSAPDSTANGNVDVEFLANVSSATVSFDNTGTYDGTNLNLDPHAIAIRSFSFCEAGATLAVISGVSSFREAALSVLEWRTAAEVGTLGFHVFRLDRTSDTYVKVNDEMVLGLIDVAQGGTYHLVDPTAPARGESFYRISEVTMNGVVNEYGPFTVSAGNGRLEPGEQAELAVRGTSRWPHPLNSQGEPTDARTRTALASGAAAGNALKLGVVEDGITWLPAADIASGLGMAEGAVAPLLANRLLTLRNRGKEVSWSRSPNGDGILFYGQALPSAFTAENVYWLSRSGLFRGRVMATVDGRAPVAVPAPTFREITRSEQNRIALTSLEARPDSDFWYWDVVVTGTPKTFAARADAPTSGNPARLTVRGRGATGETHRLNVDVGGTPVGQGVARGTDFFTMEFDVPASLLKDGTVEVRVTRLADGATSGGAFVDSLELSYRRSSVAVKDELTLNADGTGVVTVEGLTKAAVTVLDVSDALAPTLVLNPAVDGSGPYRVSFVPGTADGRYVVATTAAFRKPAWVRPAAEKSLKNRTNEGEYLVIHPAELAGTAAALVDLRSGMKPKAVSLDAIYDEFAYGLATPVGIRDFVRYAAETWRVPPQYVVLLGNGSFDYRNFWGRNDNLLPPLLVSTNPGGLSSSDNLIADLDGDGLPDLAIGRIPAVTDAQGLGYVRKLRAYESATGAWKATALLAADAADAVDYTAASRELAGHLPAGYASSTVYLPEHPLAEARRLLIDGLNQGVGLVNWTGHGGTDRLSKAGLLTLDDMPSLVSKDRFSLMSATTCVVNRFEYPGYASLGEQLVLKENGGAIAVWSSSALSFPDVARELSEDLFDVYHDGSQPIGDAVLEALHRYAERGSSMNHVYTYVLLGDPAARYVAP